MTAAPIPAAPAPGVAPDGHTMCVHPLTEHGPDGCLHGWSQGTQGCQCPASGVALSDDDLVGRVADRIASSFFAHAPQPTPETGFAAALDQVARDVLDMLTAERRLRPPRRGAGPDGARHASRVERELERAATCRLEHDDLAGQRDRARDLAARLEAELAQRDSGVQALSGLVHALRGVVLPMHRALNAALGYEPGRLDGVPMPERPCCVPCLIGRHDCGGGACECAVCHPGAAPC